MSDHEIVAVAQRSEGLQGFMRAVLEKGSPGLKESGDEFVSTILALFRQQSVSGIERAIAIIQKSLRLCSW